MVNRGEVKGVWIAKMSPGGVQRMQHTFHELVISARMQRICTLHLPDVIDNVVIWDDKSLDSSSRRLDGDRAGGGSLAQKVCSPGRVAQHGGIRNRVESMTPNQHVQCGQCRYRPGDPGVSDTEY